MSNTRLGSAGFIFATAVTVFFTKAPEGGPAAASAMLIFIGLFSAASVIAIFGDRK